MFITGADRVPPLGFAKWLAHSRKAVALEKCNHHSET